MNKQMLKLLIATLDGFAGISFNEDKGSKKYRQKRKLRSEMNFCCVQEQGTKESIAATKSIIQISIYAHHRICIIYGIYIGKVIYARVAKLMQSQPTGICTHQR